MSASTIEISNLQVGEGEEREPPFAAIAAFALHGNDATEAALDAARTVLLGALAEVFVALNQPEAMRAVRVLLAGNIRPGGARVPGTSYELEPCAAATAIGMLMGAGTDRPQQSALRACPLGAVLAMADFADRKRSWRGASPLTVRELLNTLIKAEQVRRALEQSTLLAMSERHCLLGATTAVAVSLLPWNVAQISEALQRVWQSAGAALLPAADLHAEAIRRAFDASALTAVTSTPVICDALATPSLRSYASHEHSAVVQRFEAAVQTRLPLKQCERIKAIVAAPNVLDGMAVNAFMAELVANQA